MTSSHVPLRPALAPPERDEHFGDKVRIKGRKFPGTQKHTPVCLACGVQMQQVLGGASQRGSDGRGLAAEPRYGRYGCGIRPNGAPREHLVAQEISGPRRIGVARILPPFLTRTLEERPPCFAGDIEEWSHERDAVTQFTSPAHPREPCQARAAKDTVQNRLGLVVCCVSHEHMPCAGFVGDIGQKRIPQSTRPRLEPLAGSLVTSLPYREPPPDPRQSETLSEATDERAVSRRINPQVVLRVGDQQPWDPQPHQPDQQGHAVGSSRDRDHDGKPVWPTS